MPSLAQISLDSHPALHLYCSVSHSKHSRLEWQANHPRRDFQERRYVRMPADPSFHMTIQDVFSVRGRGTVATGQIDSGTLHVGDEIQLQREGLTRKTVVTAIEGLQKLLQQANTGDNVGVLLDGIN